MSDARGRAEVGRVLMASSFFPAGLEISANALFPISEASKKPKKKKRTKRRSEAVGKLREQLRQETERLIGLAGDNAAALESELARLVSLNDALDRKQSPSVAPPPAAAAAAAPQVAVKHPHQRWITPSLSGYESDSTTADDDYASLGENPHILKGRAQTRVLIETKNALSRAAQCQVFTDPAVVGSEERREALLRAMDLLASLKL